MLQIVHVPNSVSFGDQFKYGQPPNVSRHHEALSEAGIVARLQDHIHRSLKLREPLKKSHVWAGRLLRRRNDDQMHLVVIKFWRPEASFGPSDVFAAAFRAQPGVIFPGGDPLTEEQIALVAQLVSEA